MTAEHADNANTVAASDLGFDDQAVDASLEITHTFDPAKIKVQTRPVAIDRIIKRIDHGEIDLEPSFQRRARLWNIGSKSRLIESLLLRIPLPLFYVAADSKDNWKVIDGIQRLTTIHDFVKGHFKLSGLEYMVQLANLSYPELPRAMQRRIEETQLVINIIEDGTPDDITVNIFKRLSTGGMALNQQEIRNAVYAGKARQFLRELVGLPSFQTATDHGVSDERMEAQEMVLRFLAFRFTGWKTYVEQDPGIDSFLNHAMHRINEMPATELQQLQAEFDRTMSLAHQLFGVNAFRKPTKNKREPINRPLFETWSVNLAELTKQQQATLISNKEKLTMLIDELMNDAHFNEAILFANTTLSNIRYRFEKIEQLIDNVLR
jgi:Protein of unknown function DUF262